MVQNRLHGVLRGLAEAPSWNTDSGRRRRVHGPEQDSGHVDGGD